MMNIFYGLGNNQSKYFKTKHNIGRIVVENLAKKRGLKFEKGNTFDFCKTKIDGQDFYFLYSQQFMNTSGEPLYKFINYFKLEPNKDSLLIIIQDDSDQSETGSKLSQGGGTAGHKGIESIYKHLPGTGFSIEQLWRLKIGIRPEGNKLKSETFVLKSLTENDQKTIEEVSKITNRTLNYFLPSKIYLPQNEINSLKNKFIATPT